MIHIAHTVAAVDWTAAGKLLTGTAVHLALSKPKSKTSSSSATGTIVYLLFLVVIVYFGWRLLFKPQSERAKAQRALQSELSEGDEVVTNSGIYGVVRSIEVARIHLEVSEGVIMTFARTAVGQKLSSSVVENSPERGEDGGEVDAEVAEEDSENGGRSDEDAGEADEDGAGTKRGDL